MSTNALFSLAHSTHFIGAHHTFYYIGLYYLAEMVEEYTRFAKKFLQNAIKITIGIHALLFFVDGLPFTACLVGGASQIAYSRLLKRYPFIEVQTVEFAASVAMLILTHVYWMRYFREERYSTEYAMGFFLCTTWLVPFGFFISLAANESVLPGSTSGIGGGPGAATGGIGGNGVYGPGSTGNSREKKRSNVVLQILDWVKMKWETLIRVVFPRGVQASYKSGLHTY
jgi:hypothetical protein